MRHFDFFLFYTKRLGDELEIILFFRFDVIIIFYTVNSTKTLRIRVLLPIRFDRRDE